MSRKPHKPLNRESCVLLDSRITDLEIKAERWPEIAREAHFSREAQDGVDEAADLLMQAAELLKRAIGDAQSAEDEHERQAQIEDAMSNGY